MSRKAVESLTARLYKDRLKRTGNLPCAKVTRELELKAIKCAQVVESKKGKR